MHVIALGESKKGGRRGNRRGKRCEGSLCLLSLSVADRTHILEKRRGDKWGVGHINGAGMGCEE